ncbi:poly-gamma-glutamate synthase PgsB [Coleofasciculus sp. FACHB-712]|uniref:poly-gamma-glutamate synthase PgsB n=1 Tax=Coleofasciculus sp. FACHB-712 TaxID=2692789 RepID=UPI0016895C34|nr:poly-gamma-glutamate synthase PgsB [Coleofasciculus sp. FACHB-712]MBD1945062.1 poly-gamma-glutamate synthase PgsB [Coleofasciculus sp. FACHB-712]
MSIFLLSLTSLYLYISWALISYVSFKKKREEIEWRVHINGIRGKSTVTRYTAAVFREAGYHTFGKTTGSAARILRPDGEDFDFKRKGYANVNEQVKILKGFCRQKAQAAVMECMAVNPVYAKWLEEKVMRSHIGIVTNVRYDHPDYMGETLEEIAESLSKTIPQDAIFITSESEPRLLNILWKNAKKKNSLMLIADKHSVKPEDMEGFSHFAHEENVAIGYEIAKILKLPRDRALKAMKAAVADPGAFNIEYIKFDNCTVAWANLFAVNDRESFIEVCLKLFKQLPSYKKVVLLNNRPDRPTRVELFAGMARDLEFERVVTFGAYESAVNQVFSLDPARVINLGHSTKFKSASATELLNQIVSGIDGGKVLLIGAVNIHTDQAEKLLHFFEEQLKAENSLKEEPHQLTTTKV